MSLPLAQRCLFLLLSLPRWSIHQLYERKRHKMQVKLLIVYTIQMQCHVHNIILCTTTMSYKLDTEAKGSLGNNIQSVTN